MRVNRKAVIVGAAAAVGLAALVPTGAAAYAGPDPPSGSDCPNGYWAARAYKSYYGMASGVSGPNQYTGGVPVENEMNGLGCFHRISGTDGEVQFRWSAVGPLYEGILYYQVYDCTAKTIAPQHSKAMTYPNGSGSDTHGQASAMFDPGHGNALDSNHTYAVRVTGKGSYQRPNEPMAGSIGYFAPPVPKAPPGMPSTLRVAAGPSRRSPARERRAGWSPSLKMPTARSCNRTMPRYRGGQARTANPPAMSKPPQTASPRLPLLWSSIIAIKAGGLVRASQWLRDHADAGNFGHVAGRCWDVISPTRGGR